MLDNDLPEEGDQGCCLTGGGSDGEEDILALLENQNDEEESKSVHAPGSQAQLASEIAEKEQEVPLAAKSQKQADRLDNHDRQQ